MICNTFNVELGVYEATGLINHGAMGKEKTCIIQSPIFSFLVVLYGDLVSLINKASNYCN